MRVRPVAREDIDAVVAAFVSAFAGDPLIGYLFGASHEREAHVREFFRVLLEVRVSLGMPALCAEVDGDILGGAMGYDVTRPTWTGEHLARWDRLTRDAEGAAARLSEYGALADRFEPPRAHYYLGVIGVRADAMGGGVGRALLDRFCEESARDARSHGVYLETASAASLRFYLRNGFTLRGEGVLGDGTPLWCVFKETGRGAGALP